MNKPSWSEAPERALAHSGIIRLSKQVSALASHYSQLWRDRPEMYWFARLLQEAGELGSALVGEHDDNPSWELAQIAAICLNWLDMRGVDNIEIPQKHSDITHAIQMEHGVILPSDPDQVHHTEPDDGI